MKFISARVREYKSVWDSKTFEIGDITCLVGKNEAGKTALLEAIYKLNPIIADDGVFDVTHDYPRAEVADYEEDVECEDRTPAKAVVGTFELEDADLKAVAKLFGEKALKNNTLELTRSYPNPLYPEGSTLVISLSVNRDSAVKHLVQSANLPVELQQKLAGSAADTAALINILAEAEETEEKKRLSKILGLINKDSADWYIYNSILSSRVPKFLYFDEYYQMKGRENIEAMKVRQTNETLEPSDYPMLGLIGLARLDLDQLLSPSSTQDLVNKLEGAGNRLSKKVLQYWSQNKHVQMRFDVRPANPDDPEGLTTGTNIWANVYDFRHMVSTNLGTRSRGFVWFFSFLAWYSQVQKEHRGKNIILLLDEPGLFLHGKAQEDLLQYFEYELKDKHQVIYTTHSPFMVDSQKFDRIRIVQDKGIERDEELTKEEDGTKVLTEVLEAHEDSLFPLQGALGYEIYQTLFVGKNCLVVEGVSDLLYIQTMSGYLERSGRDGLSPDWTITPVGGSDKVPTFVSLLGSQRGMKLATLIDYQKKDAQTIDNLFKKKLLKKKNVLTFSDFTAGSEADIEDMFGVSFYLKLINGEYKDVLNKNITVAALKSKQPRVLVKIEDYLKVNPLQENSKFSHYRPARYLVDNFKSFEKKIPGDAIDRFEQAFIALNALL